jgi:cytochrome c
MFRLDKLFTHLTLLALAIFSAQLAGAQSMQGASKFPGIGRSATPAEVIAWDIDVRPDFKGLLKGSGSVEQGQVIWESKCASCHGVFGESNEIFTPIAGGTTADDIKTGKVVSLTDRKQPQRTTLMKVPTVSTLWDYIYRAMPWNAPRSLTPDETYALVAFVLSLGEIVPDDFVLSNTNIAEQNRLYGPYRGSDSTKPPLAKLPGSTGEGLAHAAETHAASTKGPATLFKNENCSACHAPNAKLVGPSIADISIKYQGQSGAVDKLMAKVKNGGSGVWGSIPMPPQSQLSDEDRKTLVVWVLSGGK